MRLRFDVAVLGGSAVHLAKCDARIGGDSVTSADDAAVRNDAARQQEGACADGDVITHKRVRDARPCSHRPSKYQNLKITQSPDARPCSWVSGLDYGLVGWAT